MYDVGGNRFLLGDCFDRMAEIATGSVDMVLADLPYGTTQNKWDSVLPLEPLWREYWRVCKPGAAVVLTAQTPFDKVLGCSQLDALRYEWIWEKSEPTGFLNARRAPMKAHENILVFAQKQTAYFPQGLVPVRVSSGRKNKAGRGNYGTVNPGLYIQTEGNFPRSVIRYSTEKQTGAWHPTQKPVALFEYLIRTYTEPGALVLDNTAGSGTTAIAALNTGRRFVCIERDAEYYWRAVARVCDWTPPADAAVTA